jgi:hypothetical protein
MTLSTANTVLTGDFFASTALVQEASKPWIRITIGDCALRLSMP